MTPLTDLMCSTCGTTWTGRDTDPCPSSRCEARTLEFVVPVVRAERPRVAELEAALRGVLAIVDGRGYMPPAQQEAVWAARRALAGVGSNR